MKEKLSIVGKRFLKAFISGGLASSVLVLSQAPTPGDLLDAKRWLGALVFAFFTGGIMAIEKALQ